jgi:hypothetical protein
MVTDYFNFSTREELYVFPLSFLANKKPKPKPIKPEPKNQTG